MSFLYREHESLSMYGDTKTAREIMIIELKKVIEANPIFRDKLNFPTIKRNRLRRLVNQRLLSLSFLDLSFCVVFLSMKENQIGLRILLRSK